MASYQTLESKIDAIYGMIANGMKPIRGEPTKEVKGFLLKTIAQAFGGWCPCCGRIKIVIVYEDEPDALQCYRKTERCELDHYTDNPGKNQAHEVWYICDECNRRFDTGTLPRWESVHAFNEFQRRLRQVMQERQLTLPFPLQ